MIHLNIIRKYPYATLLIAFSFLGGIGDFLYARFSELGEITLLIAPGEIIRGLFLLCLIYLLLKGRLYIHHFLLFVLIIFLSVSLINDFTQDKIEFIERQFRLLFLVKFFFMILITSLVIVVFQRREMTPNQLLPYLLAWLFIFHVIPIILSSYGILGYQVLNYRGVENRGIIFAINASSIILVSTYSFYAFPKSILGLFLSLIGFMACETVGTKSAAVAGLLIPAIVFGGGVAFGKIKSLKPIIIFIIIVAVLICFKDFFLKHQYTYLGNYMTLLDSGDRGFLNFLTSGRSGYFYSLGDFFRENSFLELLIGSHAAGFNEMDQMAMLTRYGIFGLVIYLIIAFKILKTGFSIMKKGWFEFQIFVSIAAIITHSVLGGHVLTNPVVSFPVAFVVGTALYLSWKEKEEPAAEIVTSQKPAIMPLRAE